MAAQADGGMKRVGFTLGAEWRLASQLSRPAFGEYHQVLGSAAASPLVRSRSGSADQSHAGLFLVGRLYSDEGVTPRLTKNDPRS